MSKTLDECRWFYNRLLEQRQRMWEDFGENVSLYDQHAYLLTLKSERPSLDLVHSQVLQNVCMRVDLAFKAFFRRVKSGETPGYPRFRGKGRYDSFTFPQAPSGCKLGGSILTLSKIGKVKVLLHRPVEGTLKTVCIHRSSTGKWFVTFSCELDLPEPLPKSTESVGIDVGLARFATLSNEETIENPRFFRTEEKALAKVQRRLAKEAKRTPRYLKRKKVVARVHERTANRRKDFAHQHSRRIVDRFQVIAVEDLEVNRMVHNRCLSKSISDAAWSAFSGFLAYKAAWAGRQFVAVNPAYTSQDCNGCGHRQKLSLCERTFSCPCCGVVLDRDHNAALNIKALGLQRVGLSVEAPVFMHGE